MGCQSREFPDTVKKALSYIVKSRDPNGNWYSKQASVYYLPWPNVASQMKSAEVKAYNKAKSERTPVYVSGTLVDVSGHKCNVAGQAIAK
jgi:hypothetical protein